VWKNKPHKEPIINRFKRAAPLWGHAGTKRTRHAKNTTENCRASNARWASEKREIGLLVTNVRHNRISCRTKPWELKLQNQWWRGPSGRRSPSRQRSDGRWRRSAEQLRPANLTTASSGANNAADPRRNLHLKESSSESLQPLAYCCAFTDRSQIIIIDLVYTSRFNGLPDIFYRSYLRYCLCERMYHKHSTTKANGTGDPT